MVLKQNRFFDGRTFDPDDLEGYLAGLENDAALQKEALRGRSKSPIG
jgi:hypothetical protein